MYIRIHLLRPTAPVSRAKTCDPQCRTNALPTTSLAPPRGLTGASLQFETGCARPVLAACGTSECKGCPAMSRMKAVRTDYSLPSNLQEIVDRLPPNVDRRAGAAAITQHMFPVSHRTLESWE